MKDRNEKQLSELKVWLDKQDIKLVPIDKNNRDYDEEFGNAFIINGVFQDSTSMKLGSSVEDMKIQILHNFKQYDLELTTEELMEQYEKGKED